MKLEWHGYYFDGRTAARREAKIHLAARGLEILPHGGEPLFWPYSEIRQTQGFYAGEQVRLERGVELGETLLVAEQDFLHSVRRFAPELTSHFHEVRPRRFRILAIVLAVPASIAIIAALYFWGVPALASAVARYVPVRWEEQLGSAIVDHLAPEETRCTDAAIASAIDVIVTALTARARDNPYTLRVFVVKEPTVNALAAPGGYIVVFQGLLEHTETPEELAGVLAHETQHILKRHATRALLEHATTRILLSALLGDTSGIGGFGLESARVLGILSYSRRNEQEADAAGMRMLLEAGIDPEGMIAFFETMKKLGGPQPQILAYLSTHPSTDDRIEKLRSLVGTRRQKPRELLPGRDWKYLRSLCATSPPEDSNPAKPGRS